MTKQIFGALPLREHPDIDITRSTMNGKPVFSLEINTVVNFDSAFDEKLLCDGLTFSLGSACVCKCKYCYVESLVRQHPNVLALLREIEPLGLKFEDITIRKKNAIDLMVKELTFGKPRKIDLQAPLVIFTSPLVDPAPNMTLAVETLEACMIICDLTNWTIRILSKCGYLRWIAEQIPERYKRRFIFGVSTGTFDDKIAQKVEEGTALVASRLKELHWLQDNGFRTFGMVCPSLPQEDPDHFVAEALEKIRADLCEHVWAEVLNIRGDSLNKSCDALEAGGFHEEASRLRGVSGAGHGEAWEQYARETFLAYTRHLGPEKLRFLQYPSGDTVTWWAQHRHQGALLLGLN
jgi:DNA repair photolyase